MLSLYFLACYTSFYVPDAEMRDQLGQPMIIVTLLNFVINFLPIILGMLRVLCRKIRRCFVKEKIAQ